MFQNVYNIFLSLSVFEKGTLTRYQCDQIGQFCLFFLVTNYVTKVAQISHLSLGCFEKHHFLIKTVAVTFGQLFEEFGLHFIPTSGHTHSQCLFRFRVCVVILNDEAEFHLVAVLILPSYLRYLPIPTNLGT